MSEPCPHTERTDGVCVVCGDCIHDVILNGACFYCGTTDLDPEAISPKKTPALIPATALKPRR